VADLAPVTVNCSGIGARTLADDAELVVVRGQIVRTTNPGLTVSVRDLTPEAGVAEGILLRCQQSVPALAGATVLSHAVGLRPGRSTVRLKRTTPWGQTGCWCTSTDTPARVSLCRRDVPTT
jgi:D-amino-acid oxidase